MTLRARTENAGHGDEQELGEATLDLLGLGLRSGEPEQDVIGVPDVTQPPIPWIPRISGRESTPLLLQRPHRGTIALAAGSLERAFDPLIRRVIPSACASGVFRHQSRLDELVQPIQVNVGQARGENPAI